MEKASAKKASGACLLIPSLLPSVLVPLLAHFPPDCFFRLLLNRAPQSVSCALWPIASSFKIIQLLAPKCGVGVHDLPDIVHSTNLIILFDYTV